MPARYSAQDARAQDVFSSVTPSVYMVLAGDSADAIKQGHGVQGSAVAVSPEWALTNCHVVKDQQFIALVDDRTKQTFEVSVSRAHEPSDRCFLKARNRLNPIEAVRRMDDLAVGERVYTIGNPSGLSKTLGEGLISGLRKHGGVSYVQTNAPISQGSSGGALVDSKGALVGVTTFLLKDTQNLNFAIAAEEYWR